MTTSIFQEWFVHFFRPLVERYCAQHGLLYKALLILDSARGHPGNVDDLCDHVRVEYLPKNTTAPIQSMNQGVVATFKTCYLWVFHLLALKAGDRDQQCVIFDFW